MVCSAFAQEPTSDVDYLKALRAWDQRDWSSAYRLSNRALEADPGHRPAQLLSGYASLRLGHMDDGIESLRAISGTDAPDDRVRYMARAVLYQRLDRWSRDDIELSFGIVSRWDAIAHVLKGRAGISLQAAIPVKDDYKLRLDGRVAFPGAGWHLSATASRSFRLGQGAWHTDLGLGPSVWLVNRFDPSWEEPPPVIFGIRAAVGTDVRLSRGFGFRIETGYTFSPRIGDILDGYTSPLDVRFTGVYYFHKNLQKAVLSPPP